MTDELLNEFGGPPPDDDEPSPPVNNLIPFPRMRPSTRLREAWTTEVQRFNKEHNKRHQLISPLDAVPSLIRKRSMPSMHWPPGWVNLADRCVNYVGECIGITGAIGGGKTSFALQVAVANTGHGHPAIWQALELDAEQVDLRAIASQNGVGMREVREHWSEERIRHSLTAIDDMWHFVDQHDDPEESFSALEDAINIAWRVYRVPPVWVVDHLGELVAEERDDRAAIRRWAQRYRRLALRTNSWGLLLNQVSKSNQAVTTGRVDLESAADAMGIEMGSQAIASSVSNNIVLVTFAADDAPELDAHALVPKARNTGKVGRVGMRLRKSAGGRWSELDSLPSTPSQVKAEIEKAKRDKHRVGPPPTPAQARADLNAVIEGDAAATRRVKALEAITRHGALGIEITELRKVYGVGRGAVFQQTLHELLRAGAVERVDTRVRRLTRDHD